MKNKQNIFDLSGKVAVVTGVKGLLGPIWTKALLGAGARVAGIDLKDSKPSRDFKAVQRGCNARVFKIYDADILVKGNLEKAFANIKKDFGVPTILVNNAGIDQPPSPSKKEYYFEEIPFDVGRKILDVNVLGSFLMIQVFGSEMTKLKKSSIINIASHYGLVSPDPHFYNHIKNDPPFIKPPMYGPSKAALIQLTKYMSVLWGKYNVRVNCISPGGVTNNQDPRFVKKYTTRVPLGRMAVKEDLAGPLVFLASDASSYLTGTNIVVDGGFTAL